MAKDPFDAAAEAREKLAAERNANDHKLWEQWKQNPTPENTQPLMAQLRPVFEQRARQWKAPKTSGPAFEAELKIQALKAFETYDPSRGTVLRTHVENRLRKAHRFNTQQQNLAYIPEGKGRFIGHIDSAKNELTEEYGREPTPQELADIVNERVGPRRALTAAKVQEIQDARLRDTSESAFESDPTPRIIARDREVIDLLAPTLRDDERAVFNHLYGKDGKKQTTSTNELSSLLGKTPSQVSRLRSSILKKVEKYQ